MKKLLAVILAILVFAASAGIQVMASDTSGALWSGVVRVTNNSTAASIVSVNFTANTSVLIANGYVNTSVNNTSIQISGNDVPYMPGYAGNPWVVFLDSMNANEIRDGTLYTGGSSMNSTIRYFPGTVGANVTDNAGIEPANNSTITVKGYVDMSQSGYIFNKSGALSFKANKTPGTISVGDLPTYTEIEPGGWLTLNGTDNLTVSTSATNDAYSYKDYGAGFFNALNLNFTLQIAAEAANPFGYGGIAITNTVDDISGWAATDLFVGATTESASLIQFRIVRGNTVSQNVSANVSPGTYYVTVSRAAANDSVTAYFYSDSARTVLTSNLTLGGFGATTYRYGFDWVNNNVGLNRVLAGSIADFDIVNVTATSGEHTITRYSNGTKTWLTVGSTASDNVTAISIPDTANRWVFGSVATPYIEYMEVDVGGNQKGYWAWQYATTFTDLSGNGNTMTPSFWTTSSDADISAELLAFEPVETAIAPPYTVEDPPDFITDNITVSGGFTSNTTGSTAPGIAVVSDLATAGNTPVPFVLYLFIGLALVALSFGISYLMRMGGSSSLVIKLLIMMGALGILMAISIVDDWVLYLFAMIGIGIAFIASNRQFEGTGNTGNNMLGFLIMSWLGLMVVNNILEGVILTSAERTSLNDFLIFQPWNVANWFVLPVPSVRFLTVGLPALMEWNYTAFGGSAQIFTYLMYSISGVVAFMFFTVAMGAAANMFFRSR